WWCGSGRRGGASIILRRLSRRKAGKPGSSVETTTRWCRSWRSLTVTASRSSRETPARTSAGLSCATRPGVGWCTCAARKIYRSRKRPRVYSKTTAGRWMRREPPEACRYTVCRWLPWRRSG
ncbi:MAG: hypothetical protein AVDCRST_MAG80-1339, partial [uncultured Rubrobacteraceae bacterium]